MRREAGEEGAVEDMSHTIRSHGNRAEIMHSIFCDAHVM
jgi:hypothetical protein